MQHVPPLAHSYDRFHRAGVHALIVDGMSPTTESASRDRDEGPTFLSRVVLSVVLLTAGIGVAVFVSAL